jgi:hypothetical protein
MSCKNCIELEKQIAVLKIRCEELHNQVIENADHHYKELNTLREIKPMIQQDLMTPSALAMYY